MLVTIASFDFMQLAHLEVAKLQGQCAVFQAGLQELDKQIAGPAASRIVVPGAS